MVFVIFLYAIFILIFRKQYIMAITFFPVIFTVVLRISRLMLIIFNV